MLQSSLERKRSRFGQQGASFLSWSVDASASQPDSSAGEGGAAAAAAAAASPKQLAAMQQQQQQQLPQLQLSQLLQQQSSDASAASSPTGSQGGAECYVFARMPAALITSCGSGTAPTASNKAATNKLATAGSGAPGGPTATATAPNSSSSSSSPATKLSPRGPPWRHHPWTPRKALSRAQQTNSASGSTNNTAEQQEQPPVSPGRRSPRKSVVSTVPVQELAAVFERRCSLGVPAAALAQQGSAGSGSSLKGCFSPRRSKTPEGSAALGGGISPKLSPRVSHFNAQQQLHSLGQQQQLQQLHSRGGHSSPRHSPSPNSPRKGGNPGAGAASKPGSPFFTLGGQKQALNAWEGGSPASSPSQQQQQAGGGGVSSAHSAPNSSSSSSSSSSKQRRVPPLVWPPSKASAAQGSLSASSSAAALPLSHSKGQLLSAQSSQQALLQPEASTASTAAAAAASASAGGANGTAAGAGGTSGGSDSPLQGNLASSSSTTGSSRGGSPFKPKPPASGSSPQRSRPSFVGGLRPTFSAPVPAAAAAAGAPAGAPVQPTPAAAEGQQQKEARAGGAAGTTAAGLEAAAAAGVSAAGTAAAAKAASAGGASAVLAPAAVAAAASAAAASAPRGLRAIPLLTRNKPLPVPCLPQVAASPRALTHPDANSPRLMPYHQMVDINTPRVGTPRSSAALLAAGAEGTSSSRPHGAAALSTPRAAALNNNNSDNRAAGPSAQQAAADAQAMQAMQLQEQQVQAMQQQLKMQQSAGGPSSPQLPVRAQPAAVSQQQHQQQHQQQQQCVPIAIARHCPQDLQGPSWQPRDFIQTKKLYEGKIAAVVQGYHAASGRPLALKVYNRARLDTMERFQLAREVCLHMRSCHPSITALYAAYKDARYIYLLMELAPSGNLYQMLMAMPVAPGRPRCLPERDAVVRVIRPLLSALGYLHEQGIIHRDIKLENVLLTAEGDIKLADFGLSIDTRHEPANTRLGTQGYFAPEVLALPLKSSPFEGKSPEEAAARPSYDCKVDVWSAGVVCFEVLTGRAPFAAENVAQVLQAILHRQLVYPGHLSQDAVSFLSTALTRDPRVRPTVKELLQHKFITMHTQQQQQQQ